MQDQLIVNDVTQLNPIKVAKVLIPQTVEEIQKAVKEAAGSVSIGGGRFSMGGQTASPNTLHLDMRQFNKVIALDVDNKTICVQTGIRWRDIQKHIDPKGLSIKIMQTYSNFSVGGSLSVNVHGRYMGLGPLILSVRSIAIVLANGELVKASPEENSHIFYGAIGGYGGLGVIVEAELDLSDNIRVERRDEKMETADYFKYFCENVRESEDAVFHNADIYPPHYTKLRAVTWSKTEKPATHKESMIPEGQKYGLEKYFYWAFSETPFGKWRREHIIDPLIYSKNKVHWKNYEASYDVAELEPKSRKKSTYVLQEYFVPIARFDEFMSKMAEILQRHDVNMINISVRHAKKDSGALMAWAADEVFAFVLYYKQGVSDVDKNRVAVWTRELVEAAISCDGCYYLPYQPHATSSQLHRAYPRAKELFELKDKYDPNFKFKNIIWDTYYKQEEVKKTTLKSEFHQVFSSMEWSDKFYRFLQVIYRIYPEDKFHYLIKEIYQNHEGDEAIYKEIQKHLPRIKAPLSDLTYALPALLKQKKEMTRQTLELLNGKTEFNGYLEIGSPGRYISDLKKLIKVTGDLWLMDEKEPSFSPADLMERGRLPKLGKYVPLNDYDAFVGDKIKADSLDIVTCHIGLHHTPKDKLEGFVNSIYQSLRTGGILILRDHDVKDSEMFNFVALVHTVFNAGLNIDWSENEKEVRNFESIAFWSDYLQKAGFKDDGRRLLQENDPSDNTLMAFIKE